MEQHTKVSIDVSEDTTELEEAIDDIFGGFFSKELQE